MSRIRYLKPGFFHDEDLADCSHLARILFAGLWTIADREGRLEDRPRQIRAKVLPYDDCDANALLQELADHGPLIVRYSAEGKHYICVPGWGKHQKPHSKEVPSTIPEPTEHDLGSDNARPRQCEDTTKVDTSTASRARVTGNGQRGTGTGNGNGDGKEPSSASDEANELVLLAEAVPIDKDPHGTDFLEWWDAYGKIGNRRDARPCYVYWRKEGVSKEKLLLASANYIQDCHVAQRSIAHGSTFLAKKKTQEDSRWLEWTTGEEHGDGHVHQRSGRQVDTTFGVLRQLIEEEA